MVINYLFYYYYYSFHYIVRLAKWKKLVLRTSFLATWIISITCKLCLFPQTWKVRCKRWLISYATWNLPRYILAATCNQNTTVNKGRQMAGRRKPCSSTLKELQYQWFNAEYWKCFEKCWVVLLSQSPSLPVDICIHWVPLTCVGNMQNNIWKWYIIFIINCCCNTITWTKKIL